MAMFYFAYGSNMCTERLQRRVPSAQPISRAQLPGCELAFHKRGKDGSAKCSIMQARESTTVHGVVFKIDPNEKEHLDRAEGLGAGYTQETVRVESVSGTRDAFTYQAMQSYINEELTPFEWYKQFVVRGARQHRLPQAYVRQIASVTARPDPDRKRARRNRRVLADAQPRAGGDE